MVKDIVLTGKFEGDLQTLGCLTVASGGVVTGSIDAGALVLEPGNLVEARVKVGAAAPARRQGVRRDQKGGGKPVDGEISKAEGIRPGPANNVFHEKADPSGSHLPPLPGDAERARRGDFHQLPLVRKVFQSWAAKADRARPALPRPTGKFFASNAARPTWSPARRFRRSASGAAIIWSWATRSCGACKRENYTPTTTCFSRRAAPSRAWRRRAGAWRCAEKSSASCARRRKSSRRRAPTFPGNCTRWSCGSSAGPRSKVQELACARLLVSGAVEISGALTASEIILSDGAVFSGRLQRSRGEAEGGGRGQRPVRFHHLRRDHGGRPGQARHRLSPPKRSRCSAAAF